MHKCSFILKGKNGKASGNCGSNKRHLSGGLIPWARLLGEVFPRFLPFMSSTAEVPACESREFPSASPGSTALDPHHFTDGGRELQVQRRFGGVPLWEMGVSLLPAYWVPTLPRTRSHRTSASAPCRFPDEKTLCEQFALPQGSLSGESVETTVHPKMWPHSLSSPGSGTAEGPQLCWERNEIYSQGEVGECIHTQERDHFGCWLYFFPWDNQNKANCLCQSSFEPEITICAWRDKRIPKQFKSPFSPFTAKLQWTPSPVVFTATRQINQIGLENH